MIYGFEYDYAKNVESYLHALSGNDDAKRIIFMRLLIDIESDTKIR